MRTEQAQVVIVGSGMGGGTLAWGLARSGIDVLVLERGGFLPSEPENWSPDAVFVQRRYKPDETWLDDDGAPFHPGVHYVVGGNTKVYGASLPRLRESDFGERVYPAGISPAWPFNYADLEPYYCEAEALYRVHGAMGEDPSEPWRSRPYPYPALPHEPYITELTDRLREQGLHPSSTSMGVDLAPGGACIRCSTCDGFPCRIDAKSDAQTCALGPAMAGGSVRLMTGMKVDAVEVRNGRAVAVTGIDESGDDVRVEGAFIALAAGAANTAAIMLRSGLASDLIGRNYMVHNNTHLACFDPRRRNDVVFQKTFAVNDWYEDLGDGFAGGTLQMIGKVQGSMMKTHATKAPKALLDRMAGRTMECLVMSEDLPSSTNRVRLDDQGRIVVSWTRTNYDRHEALLDRARKALREAGYAAIFEQRFSIDMNSHMCGTAVAGTDPATSVLDPLCQVHEVPNLRVVDSSFFPSSGAQNPALTIAANALRVADQADWGIR